MISKIRRFRGLNSLLPSLVASLVVVILMKLNVWTAFERSVNNHMMVGRGTSPWDSRIVMVSIDNKTLDAYGQFPISRTHYADLLLQLKKEGVSTVAFGILFADSSTESVAPDNSGINASLAGAMSTLGTVVIGQTWDDEGNATLPVPVLADTAIAVGHLQLNADSDGITRRVPVLWEGVPALGFATVQAYSLQNELISIPSDLPELRLNWPGSATQLATLSLVDVANGQYPAGYLKDKIVIVSYGATASGSQLRTPYDKLSPVPGGYLHAAVIDTLLKQNWLRPVSTDVVTMLLLMGGTGFGMLLYRRRVWVQLAISAAICLGWLLLCMVALHHSYLLPVVSPLVTLVLVGGAIAILSRLQSNALLQVRSAFLNTMSHEIRTPLNAIVNLSEMLQETQLDARQREFAETLNNSSQALLALINDVLDFSKIESGRLMIEQYPVCLSDIVERSLEMLAPRAAEKGLDLVYSVTPTTPAVVMSDPVRLQQILLNLLSNAIKFTETGEISVQVEATLLMNKPSLFSWRAAKHMLSGRRRKLRLLQDRTAHNAAARSAQLPVVPRPGSELTDPELSGSKLSGPELTSNSLQAHSHPLASNSTETFGRQSITLSQHPSGRLYEIRFAVHDTGIGIPQDRVSQLFKPFSQVSAATTRKYGGTGLGLSISKRLAERMGGDLWVRSYFGEGSTFYFTVQAPLAEATRACPSYLSGLSGTRLLLIDRNLTRRNQLTWELQPLGIRLAQATSLSEALTFMQNDPTFDGIILDEAIARRREDCAATVQTLRQTARNQSLPVILLSTLQPHAKQLPVSELISGASIVWKPVKQSSLHQALRSIQPVTLPVPAAIADPASPGQLSPQPPGAADPLTPPESAHATNVIHSTDADLPELSCSTEERKQRARLNILIAEDNKVNQRVALRLLELLGYRADVVASGIEVLTALKRQRYDVVLMDMRMPELDGIEATRQIRQMPQYARTWIIAMTANAMSRDRQRCFAAGMNDYLSKPINRDALDQALQRCLSEQRRDGKPSTWENRQ